VVGQPGGDVLLGEVVQLAFGVGVDFDTYQAEAPENTR